MAPVLRVDDDVWSELQKRAEPLVDSPNAVLRRLLGLSDRSGKARLKRDDVAVSTKTDNRRTQEYDFYEPILSALVEFGGAARVRDVLTRVQTLMSRQLTRLDHEPISSGEERWRNTAKWARKYMIYRENPPLLNPSSRFGWWDITDAGRAYLRAANARR